MLKVQKGYSSSSRKLSVRRLQGGKWVKCQLRTSSFVCKHIQALWAEKLAVCKRKKKKKKKNEYTAVRAFLNVAITASEQLDSKRTQLRRGRKKYLGGPTGHPGRSLG